MSMTVGVRVLAGSQCGSVGCVLISAGFYGLYWSPQTRFGEMEQFRLMLNTVMYGAFYGVVFGIWVAFQKKTLIASLSSFALGLAGMFTTAPIAKLFSADPQNSLCLPILAAHTVLGALVGPLVIPEWWKKKPLPTADNAD